MTKWTTADIPSQSGRTAVVTGANTGLGLETAKALAARGAHVVLAVRDTEKGKRAADEIAAAHPEAAVSVQSLDLGSLRSVRAAAEALKADFPRIDLLINNAGVMYPPKQTTEDGFELTFGTNHLGHFALTGLLLENVLAAPNSRVVTVSSQGHRIRAAIHFDDLQWERSYSRVGAYGQSKLSNLLFTYELQRRLDTRDAIAVAAHPGVSNTELMRHLHLPSVFNPLVGVLTQSPTMGALPTLRAATDPTVRGGQYFGPSGLGEIRGYPELVTSSAQSRDVDLARRLWTVSEELTGVAFPL
uniref:Short-chain dehydrogenase/reductase SDR n=1 Tax=Mycobacterium sp. (strain JLS) TaxID=164757 RepID=A0A5Q5CBF2_MYCSJ